MQSFKEIITLRLEEIRKELSKSLRELHEMQVNNRLRQLKDTHKILETRKYIARLKTALKQMGENPDMIVEVAAASISKEEEVTTKPAKKTAKKPAAATKKPAVKKTAAKSK